MAGQYYGSIALVDCALSFAIACDAKLAEHFTAIGIDPRLIATNPVLRFARHYRPDHPDAARSDHRLRYHRESRPPVHCGDRS